MSVLDLLRPRAIVRKDHARSNSALDRIDAVLKEAVTVAERIHQQDPAMIDRQTEFTNRTQP